MEKRAYEEARREDAMVREDLRQARIEEEEARELAGRAAKVWGRKRAVEQILKPVQNRLRQAQRRAEAAEGTLKRAWEYYRAVEQDREGRAIQAEVLHMEYKRQKRAKLGIAKTV